MTVNLHLRRTCMTQFKLQTITGEEFETENPALENRLLLAPNYPTLKTQQPNPEINNHDRLEDLQLIAEARPVGGQYEFVQPGANVIRFT